MSIDKRFLKSRPVCKVKFRLSVDMVGDADEVYLVGDFNDWRTDATQMKKLKNGDFTVTLDLPVDRQYQFRYLVDQSKWVNDDAADHYVGSPYPGVENSVIVV